MRVAEELAELVGDRVDVVGERAGDEGIDVADDASRRRGVLVEFLESGSGEDEASWRSLVNAPVTVVTRCRHRFTM